MIRILTNLPRWKTRLNCWSCGGSHTDDGGEEEGEDDEATNAEMDRVRRYVPKGHLFADEEDEEDEHTRMFDDEEEESDDDEEPRRGRYADDDEESEDDVMAERIIHWAPPITAVVCALIIAVSLIYHFVIA